MGQKILNGVDTNRGSEKTEKLEENKTKSYQMKQNERKHNKTKQKYQQNKII